MELVKSNSAGRISVDLKAVEVGDGLLVVITGGNAHIGAAAVGINYGAMATSSVITVPGHREDRVVKDAAEKLAKELGRTVVVVAGIHYDKMSKEEICDALRLSGELVDALAGELCKRRS
ncbi:hypothetical protein [Methanocella conradii]|uniref:prenylated flavin chaperone LpdD n=1 Tax=Methanocella conradii TaxID=1175444 RepID=UPI0024B362EC|nr:hypothetical protein [Methanocella conradii]MDI6895789.1 hypothetical protein [Methanocella conradii]